MVRIPQSLILTFALVVVASAVLVNGAPSPQHIGGGMVGEGDQEPANFAPLEQEIVYQPRNSYDDLAQQLQRLYMESPLLWNLLTRQAAYGGAYPAARPAKKAYKQCAFNAVSCFGRKK